MPPPSGSLHNKNVTERWRGQAINRPSQSPVCARACDGPLRQHYENITTYAVAFPGLALASEQGDLEKPQTITHYTL